MHIEIDDNPLTGIYGWTLYDGPEEIDEFYGKANSLGEAFEAIIARRTMIGLEYSKE